MRIVRVFVLLIVVTLPTMITQTANAEDNPCVRTCSAPPVRTVSNGYTYSYDARAREFVGTQVFGVAGASGVSYDVRNVIDCGVAQPPDAPPPPENLDCAQAFCAAGARVGRWMIAWVRETAPNPAVGWTAAGRHCAVATDPIPLAAVEAAVTERLRRIVDPAVPVVQPGAVTLVNFPTIVSTHDPGPLTFALDQPLPGLVAVDPAFGWAFTDPDGGGATATGSGTGFDGTPPSTPGHYLTHVFPAAGTGTVAVTETWTGTVTVQGAGPVALDPLAYTRAVDLVVRENRPVLTAP